jgi:hypothetical protein
MNRLHDPGPNGQSNNENWNETPTGDGGDSDGRN